MKYLSKFFRQDRQSNQQSSTALTSYLYSNTFLTNIHNQLSDQRENSDQSTLSLSRSEVVDSSSPLRHNSSTTKNNTSQGEEEDHLVESFVSFDRVACRAKLRLKQQQRKRQTERLVALGNYLLTATIGNAKANTSSIASLIDNNDQKQSQRQQVVDCAHLVHVTDDDWVLIDEPSSPKQKQQRFNAADPIDCCNIDCIEESTTNQMALDKSDVDLIRASWAPVRRDPKESGILFFRSLFIKFPQYLKFFPLFEDLDLERLHENRRLLRHAVKVMDTVTFVVDAIGEDEKSDELNEALTNLVNAHIQRRIGHNEFRNLGIVLIDFVCDLNRRRGSPTDGNGSKIRADGDSRQKRVNNSLSSDGDNRSSSLGGEVSPSDLSSIESETMTSALDKIQACSTPSLPVDLIPGVGGDSRVSAVNNDHHVVNDNDDQIVELKIRDTSVLVAAWTKLYSVILDLVKRQEQEAAEEV